MSEKPHRTSPIKQTLAVTLVMALVLTMPGSTGWADSSVTSNTNGGPSTPRVVVTGNGAPHYQTVLQARDGSSVAAGIASNLNAVKQVFTLEETIKNLLSKPLEQPQFISANAAVGTHADVTAFVRGGSVFPEGTLSASETPLAYAGLTDLSSIIGPTPTDGSLVGVVRSGVSAANAAGAGVPVFPGSKPLMETLQEWQYGHPCDDHGSNCTQSVILDAHAGRDQLSNGTGLARKAYHWITVAENDYVKAKLKTLAFADGKKAAEKQATDLQTEIAQLRAEMAAASKPVAGDPFLMAKGASPAAAANAQRYQKAFDTLMKKPVLITDALGNQHTFFGLTHALANLQQAVIPDFQARIAKSESNADIAIREVDRMRTSQPSLTIADQHTLDFRILGELDKQRIQAKTLQGQLAVASKVTAPKKSSAVQNTMLANAQSKGTQVLISLGPVAAPALLALLGLNIAHEEYSSDVNQASIAAKKQAASDEATSGTAAFGEWQAGSKQATADVEFANDQVDSNEYADLQSGKIAQAVASLTKGIATLQSVIDKNSALYNDLLAVRNGTKSVKDLSAAAAKYLGHFQNIDSAIVSVGASDYKSAYQAVQTADASDKGLVAKWFGDKKSGTVGLYQQAQNAQAALDNFNRHLYESAFTLPTSYIGGLGSVTPEDQAVAQSFIRSTGRAYQTLDGQVFPFQTAALAENPLTLRPSNSGGHIDPESWAIFKIAQEKGFVTNFQTYAANLDSQNSTFNKVVYKVGSDIENHPGVAVAEMGGLVLGAALAPMTAGASGVVPIAMMVGGATTIAAGATYEGIVNGSDSAKRAVIAGLTSAATTAAGGALARGLTKGVAIALRPFAAATETIAPVLPETVEAAAKSTTLMGRISQTIDVGTKYIAEKTPTFTKVDNFLGKIGAKATAQVIGGVASITVPASIAMWGVDTTLAINNGEQIGWQSWGSGLGGAVTRGGRQAVLGIPALVTGNTQMMQALLGDSQTWQAYVDSIDGPFASSLVGFAGGVGDLVGYATSGGILTGVVKDLAAAAKLGKTTTTLVTGLAQHGPMAYPTVGFSVGIANEIRTGKDIYGHDVGFRDVAGEVVGFAAQMALSGRISGYSAFAEPHAAASKTTFLGDVAKETFKLGSYGVLGAGAGAVLGDAATIGVAWSSMAIAPVKEAVTSFVTARAETLAAKDAAASSAGVEWQRRNELINQNGKVGALDPLDQYSGYVFDKAVDHVTGRLVQNSEGKWTLGGEPVDLSNEVVKRAIQNRTSNVAGENSSGVDNFFNGLKALGERVLAPLVPQAAEPSFAMARGSLFGMTAEPMERTGRRGASVEPPSRDSAILYRPREDSNALNGSKPKETESLSTQAQQLWRDATDPAKDEAARTKARERLDDNLNQREALAVLIGDKNDLQTVALERSRLQVNNDLLESRTALSAAESSEASLPQEVAALRARHDALEAHARLLDAQVAGPARENDIASLQTAAVQKARLADQLDTVAKQTALMREVDAQARLAENQVVEAGDTNRETSDRASRAGSGRFTLTDSRPELLKAAADVHKAAKAAIGAEMDLTSGKGTAKDVKTAQEALAEAQKAHQDLTRLVEKEAAAREANALEDRLQQSSGEMKRNPLSNKDARKQLITAAREVLDGNGGPEAKKITTLEIARAMTEVSAEHSRSLAAGGETKTIEQLAQAVAERATSDKQQKIWSAAERALDAQPDTKTSKTGRPNLGVEIERKTKSSVRETSLRQTSRPDIKTAPVLCGRESISFSRSLSK